MDTKEKLAKKETELSNERTFLAYTRTASSILVLAVALFKFFESKLIVSLGIVAGIVGLAILILGIVRYFQEKRRILDQVST